MCIRDRDIILTADFCGFAKKSFAGNDDSGFALNRFHEKCARVVSDGFAEGASIAEGNYFEAGSERAEAVAILLVGREAHDGNGAAVKIVGTDDDLGFSFGNALDLVTPLASGLDRGFDCFGAGVHGKDHVCLLYTSRCV